jgi:electron transport complex protein RnfD
MRDVIIALAPAAIMGVVFFGLEAAIMIIMSIASCVAFEAIYQKIAKKPVTVNDLSAVVTGLLLAMNMPALKFSEHPIAVFAMPIVGAFVAIVITKQLFGGIGQNFMNPALIGRAFLLASYPTLMSGSAFGSTNFGGMAYDGVTSATPLTAIKAACKAGETVNVSTSDIVNALIGNIGGTIGEVCAIALILGGIYLIARKVISWRIPVVYILTVFVLTYVFKLFVPVAAARVPVYELFTGGLMLGAFFMATDYASSPVTPKGQLIMGFGCGLITVLIRIFGGYPEGVSYSILLMNCCVPLIDRWTRPRIFGEVKK